MRKKKERSIRFAKFLDLMQTYAVHSFFFMFISLFRKTVTEKGFETYIYAKVFEMLNFDVYFSGSEGG